MSYARKCERTDHPDYKEDQCPLCDKPKVGPIKEATREERMERALLAIESLAMCEEERDAFASKVYMIAHAATTRCNSVCRDWIALVEECEEFGKKMKIYDVEEAMSGHTHG